VGSLLFQKAILGLLKERRKTILLVLTQYKYLKYADRILLIQNGQLNENSQTISGFIESSIEDNSEDVDLSEEKIINYSKKVSAESNEMTRTSVPEEKTANEAELKENEEEEEEKEQGEIKLKTFMTFINAMGKGVFILIIIGGALMQISKAWFDFWLRDYLTAYSHQDVPWFYLGSFELTLLTVTIIAVLCTAYRAWIFAYGNLLSAKVIFNKLVPKVLYARMPFFDQNPVGRILQRFSGDTWSLDYQFSFNWNILLNEFMSFLRILYVFITQVPLVLTRNIIFLSFLKC